MVAISFSKGSSWLKNQTQISCIAGRFFTGWATREASFTFICFSIVHLTFDSQASGFGQEDTASITRRHSGYTCDVLRWLELALWRPTNTGILNSYLNYCDQENFFLMLNQAGCHRQNSISRFSFVSWRPSWSLPTPAPVWTGSLWGFCMAVPASLPKLFLWEFPFLLLCVALSVFWAPNVPSFWRIDSLGIGAWKVNILSLMSEIIVILLPTGLIACLGVQFKRKKSYFYSGFWILSWMF